MKKIGLSLLSVMALGAFSPALAQTEKTAMFISGKIGYASTILTDNAWKQSDNLRDGIAVYSAAIGVDFKKMIRTELEFTARDGWENKRTSLNNNNAMFNVYYNFFPRSTLSPFIGAGLGLSWNKADDGFTKPETSTNFAWQATAGISLAIIDNLNIDLAYRYFQVENLKIGSGATGQKVDIVSNEILLGVRFSF